MKALLIISSACVFLFHPAFGFTPGSLIPPGPPGPTMKTLDQVEPRIIVNATNTPGDAGNVFRIAAPGSYYLTANVTAAAGMSGIEITSGHVTLDLNGFTVQGVNGSGSGIWTHGTGYDHIVIRNGIVAGFGADGVNVRGDGQADGALLEGLHCTGNGGSGFEVSGAVLRACTATDNGGPGINVEVGRCVITECRAGFNGSGGIISALSASVITGCIAEYNSNRGFWVGEGSVLKASIAYANTDGIFAEQGAVVRECVAQHNAGPGIRAGENSQITGNTSSGNGAGIEADWQYNLIEGNHLTENSVGLRVDAPNNIVRGNTVRLNSDNYSIIPSPNQVEILLSQLPETIDFPAQVVLTGDLTGTSGIVVNSDNVTIDLAGHALIGAGGGDGIAVSGTRFNITVRNGTIRNWSSDGIDATNATQVQLSDLIVYKNIGTGVKAGTSAQVRRVIFRQNGLGLTTGNNAVVADCTCEGSSSVGVTVGTGSTVERCLVSANGGGGIQVGIASTVLGNHCDSHTGAAGIRVTGIRNRIDGNTTSRNAVGIDVVAGATGNTIIRNSALGNTAFAYNIVAGNDVGPIGPASTATSPFANISFASP